MAKRAMACESMRRTALARFSARSSVPALSCGWPGVHHGGADMYGKPDRPRGDAPDPTPRFATCCAPLRERPPGAASSCGRGYRRHHDCVAQLAFSTAFAGHGELSKDHAGRLCAQSVCFPQLVCGTTPAPAIRPCCTAAPSEICRGVQGPTPIWWSRYRREGRLARSRATSRTRRRRARVCGGVMNTRPLWGWRMSNLPYDLAASRLPAKPAYSRPTAAALPRRNEIAPPRRPAAPVHRPRGAPPGNRPAARQWRPVPPPRRYR